MDKIRVLLAEAGEPVLHPVVTRKVIDRFKAAQGELGEERGASSRTPYRT